MKTYLVGNSSQLIILKVNVSSLGLSATRAILVDLNSAATGVSVGQSADGSGDIAGVQIGAPASIINKRLSVFTRIDFSGSDKETRRQQYEQSRILVSLENGSEGFKEFNDCDRTANDEFITGFLTLHIDLK